MSGEREDDVVRELLQESAESLQKLDLDLVAFEQAPADRDLLDGICRALHAINGKAEFLGMRHLEALTHAGEDLLCRVRDGHVALDPESTTALLAMVDAIRRTLVAVEASGAEPDDDHEEEREAMTLAHTPRKDLPAAAVSAETPAPPGASASPSTAAAAEPMLAVRHS